MAICSDCNREMTAAASCDVKTIHVVDQEYGLDPYRPPKWALDPTARCHDCGVRPGGYHHLGCDVSRCPRCRGQLISCGCWSDEDADAGAG